MTKAGRVTLEESGLQPLSLLWVVDDGKVDLARNALREVDRDGLVSRYRRFLSGPEENRRAAFLCAEELTRRGVPPCFRLRHIRSKPLTLNQESDLLAHDLQWIVHRYPHQVKRIEWAKYKAVFTATSIGRRLEAGEHLHWFGNRSMGEIARGLRLDDDQQWDCSILRSDHINRIALTTDSMREGVMQALEAASSGYTSAAYSDEDAQRTLLRRHRIWLCSRISRKGKKVSPTKTALRYEQLTGNAINKGFVVKQLAVVEAAIKKSGL